MRKFSIALAGDKPVSPWNARLHWRELRRAASASRQSALLGNPEISVVLVHGGAALERLPRLVGRSRALEVVLSADDFDANVAERPSSNDLFFRTLAWPSAQARRARIRGIGYEVPRDFELNFGRYLPARGQADDDNTHTQRPDRRPESAAAHGVRPIQASPRRRGDGNEAARGNGASIRRRRVVRCGRLFVVKMTDRGGSLGQD